MTAAKRIDGMASDPAVKSLAVQRRKQSRREERTMQMTLARLLPTYLDRTCTCWTALENKPRSPISGLLQKLSGVKSGVPDVEVIQRQPGRQLVVFVELKSRAGVASKTQKQFRLEVLAAGGTWWMARSVDAVMMALYLSGVQLCRPWGPPPLEPWEGPFADPNKRLPQAPDVAARRREARRRERQRKRARKAAQQAPEPLQPPPPAGATP